MRRAALAALPQRSKRLAKEIERKFLVHNDGWKKKVRRSHKIVQAYLASTRKTSVRVRVIDGKKAFVTNQERETGTQPR